MMSLPIDIPEIEYDFVFEQQMVACVQRGDSIDIDRLDWKEPDYYEAINHGITSIERTRRVTEYDARLKSESLNKEKPFKLRELAYERKCLARMVRAEQFRQERSELRQASTQAARLDAWKVEHEADWKKVYGD